MTENNNKLLKIINIILLLLVLIGFGALFLYNYLYNSRERAVDLSDAKREGRSFVFGDITVQIEPRG